MNSKIIVESQLKKVGIIISSLYIFSLLTVIMPFYKTGINYFYIGISTLAISLFLLINPKEFRIFFSKELILFCVIYTICFFIHFNPTRLSTFIYSLFFILNFCLILPNILYYIDKRIFGLIIRINLYIFLIVMLIQQVGVVLNITVINLNPDFSEDFLSTLSWFRINSLSSEPSYGATIVAIMGIVYYYLFRNIGQELIRFWIPLLYCFVCFSSSLATALIISVLLVMIAGKKVFYLFLIPLVAYPIVINMESENRLIILIQELDFNNFVDSFISTDLSGAFRIVPNYFYIEQINLLSLNFYIGNGVDYASLYISKLMPGLENDFNFPGGALPYMLFDYGLLTFLAFSIFLGRNILTGRYEIFWLFAIFVMINANFNTQLMWIFISLFYCCRNFVLTETKKQL